MRRGFKTTAEALASRQWDGLGLNQDSKLDPIALAEANGLSVRDAADLIDINRLEELERLQPGSFSACTFDIKGKRVIVTSPLSTTARRRSDICHEVSHALLNHQVRTVQRIGDFSFFSCDPEEEQEANWLAGCLLLPRDLLLTRHRQGWNAADISRFYEVSDQMANYRIRATGVTRQVAAARRSRG